MLGIAAYARIAAVLLLAMVVVGSVGWGWADGSAFFQAGVGLFFLFAGFSRLETTFVRQIVGGLGVLLVLVIGGAILASWLRTSPDAATASGPHSAQRAFAERYPVVVPLPILNRMAQRAAWTASPARATILRARCRSHGQSGNVMPLRNYIRGAALGLILLGVACLFFVPVVGVGAAVICLFTAAVYSFVGYRPSEAELARRVVGDLGALYIALGVIMATVFVVLGFPFEGQFVVEGLGLCAFGALNVLCAPVLPTNSH